MLKSMTGHGEAQQSVDGVWVWTEVRAVNNRFLKITVSYGDRLAELESQIRALVQKYIRRGSVYVNIERQREDAALAYRINAEQLRALHKQALEIDPSVGVEALLQIPGVVEETGARDGTRSIETPDPDSALICETVERALQSLVEMRNKEGESLGRDLLANCQEIEQQLRLIEQRAPAVTSEYAQRLTDRINTLLKEHDLSIDASDVVREVGIFADKCDISEETVRLQTHIDQFREIIDAGQSDGRKLEFVSQEMLRETNTIGSKANDSQIAQSVVEIKTAIERIREMTQNVE